MHLVPVTVIEQISIKQVGPFLGHMEAKLEERMNTKDQALIELPSSAGLFHCLKGAAVPL